MRKSYDYESLIGLLPKIGAERKVDVNTYASTYQLVEGDTDYADHLGISLRLYSKTIAKIGPMWAVVNSGGHRTRTTRDRLDRVLVRFGLRIMTWTTWGDNNWYLTKLDQAMMVSGDLVLGIEFADGMHIVDGDGRNIGITYPGERSQVRWYMRAGS